MGFADELEKGAFGFLLLAIIVLILVQAITGILKPLGVPMIKAGFAISLIFYTIAAITLLQLPRLLSVIAKTADAREAEIIAKKSVIKWGLVIGFIAFGIGYLLQFLAPALFAIQMEVLLPLQTEIALPLMSISGV